LIHFYKVKRLGTLLLVGHLGFDSFLPGNTEMGDTTRTAHWFAFRGTDILVSRTEDAFSIPRASSLAHMGVADGPVHFLGLADGLPCRAVELPADAAAPAGWSFEGVRTLFGLIADSFFAVAARALEVLEWDRTHRYCGACGAATVTKEGERARECPSCKSLSYPRISPAVIVAVNRGEQILLARARRFPPGFYSVLAGFVEPGETLEECVMREVKEETSVDVKNLRYFASQPWPFPHSLMIAFTADWADGEIRVDETELVEANWYTVDALPHIPDPITVARRLIDNWIAARREGRPGEGTLPLG
jgi:NAD+ diphosphatase